jgi:hypothetical protein
MLLKATQRQNIFEYVNIFLITTWVSILQANLEGPAQHHIHSLFCEICWTTERGGVNQLLPCLNNYASFKIFTRHSMMITIMQGNKQWHIQHQSHI